MSFSTTTKNLCISSTSSSCCRLHSRSFILRVGAQSYINSLRGHHGRLQNTSHNYHCTTQQPIPSSLITIGRTRLSTIGVAAEHITQLPLHHTTTNTVFITNHRPHSTIHHRAPSFSNCHCSYLDSCLPQHVNSETSLLVYRSCLKTHLFTISNPSP